MVEKLITKPKKKSLGPLQGFSPKPRKNKKKTKRKSKAKSFRERQYEIIMEREKQKNPFKRRKAPRSKTKL